MSRKPHGVAPLGPVEKGIVSRMKEADAKTYLVLCAHADRHTWEAYPGVARMADLAGLTERAVEVALSRLRGLGAITTARGGGRQRKSVHRLLSNPEPPCALSAAETPNHNAPFACTDRLTARGRASRDGLSGRPRLPPKPLPRLAALPRLAVALLPARAAELLPKLLPRLAGTKTTKK